MRLNLPVSQQNYDFPGDELLVSSTNTKGEITHCNPASCASAAMPTKS
jgi:aerotaxis receptor